MNTSTPVVVFYCEGAKSRKTPHAREEVARVTRDNGGIWAMDWNSTRTRATINGKVLAAHLVKRRLDLIHEHGDQPANLDALAAEDRELLAGEWQQQREFYCPACTRKPRATRRVPDAFFDGILSYASPDPASGRVELPVELLERLLSRVE